MNCIPNYAAVDKFFVCMLYNMLYSEIWEHSWYTLYTQRRIWLHVQSAYTSQYSNVKFDEFNSELVYSYITE